MRNNGNGRVQLSGTSRIIVELKEEIQRIARSDAKVLITGESGVGKELVAQAVHGESPRKARPFVAVNCAGLPETLLESELFGHVKGSFTGAYRDKPGKLEMAEQGTIFMDEIGEMTMRMQGLLLRFMETGELQKVGGDRTDGRVDVRVIAATNRNLRDMVVQGTFREVKAVAPEAVKMLTEYSWPGNVRELENVIERCVVTGRNEMIAIDDLPMEVRMHANVGLRPKRERRRTVADDLFKRLLEERESFWSVVYPLYMQREITKGNVRDVVRKGLEEARGNYKIVARLFNMEQRDYKRFLNFLRKHDCQLPFKEYR